MTTPPIQEEFGTWADIVADQERKKSKRKKKPEAKLQKDCIAWLKANRILAWRQTVAAGVLHGRFQKFGEPGMGDIFALQPKTGRFISIELKSISGRVGPDQNSWINLVRDKGGIAGVVRNLTELGQLVREGL